MRLAIMQPYFLPYIGYFQLIAAVDLFIVYDNIKYTKKGWINRNRMLLNGTDKLFSLPLKKDSDFLDIVEREISQDFNPDKFLNQFKGAYTRAPYFVEVYPLLEQILRYNDWNLFRFIYHSIIRTCEYLGIDTKIIVSSDITIDHKLKSPDKIIAFCRAVGADTYINPVGGTKLYSKDIFGNNNIKLNFIQSSPFEYVQFDNDFVPWLSIIDVMMFNPCDTIRECIFNNYEFI
jgi:hypothetical protein